MNGLWFVKDKTRFELLAETQETRYIGFIIIELLARLHEKKARRTHKMDHLQPGTYHVQAIVAMLQKKYIQVSN
jgi:hypothetical protein